MTNILSYFKGKYHLYLLALLTGVLFGTSYIPYPAWAIAFCFIPLWYAVLKSEKNQSSLKEQFWLGWISQFVFTIIGFNWIAYTAMEFGHLHPVVSYAALVLFAGLMHIFIPLSLILATWFKRRFQLATGSHLALIVIITSLAIEFWPSIFAWNVGYPLLWMKWPLFQWADTIGFNGLSTLVLAFQAALLYGIYRKSYVLIAGSFIFVGALHFTGLQKEKKWSRTDRNVRFSLTQGNIGNEEKLASELGAQFRPAIVNKYISLTDQYISDQLQKDPQFFTDIILWPETALPIPLDPHYSAQPMQNLVQSKIKAWNSVLVSGAFSFDQFKKDHLGRTLMRNSIFFLGPSGPQQSAYYKSQLLAFGEYLPLGTTFPFLYKLLPFVGTFEKGPGPVAKKIFLANQRSVTLGPQICYESLDPAFSRGLAHAGAEVIFNVTNDSWFGDWAEPYQHLIMTLARAVEVRRPLVRATNTGISSVLLANGQELERSRINEPWMDSYDVHYLSTSPQSAFTQWGYLYWLILILALILILLKAPKGK